MILRRIKGITAVFAVCAVFASVAGYTEHQLRSAAVSAAPVSYILDAGHGIPDGGAVARDGTTEQALNLAITLRLSELLKEQGMPVQLTRTDENSIFTEGKSIHAKKVSDVKNRVSIANTAPNAPLISIHMNSYPDPSVHGIQVFYSAQSEHAAQLAAALQTALNESLQPDHVKTPKEISGGIYLFSHVSNPCVLIECGFLSNEEELEKLKTPDYQDQIARVIAQTLSAS